MTEVVVAAITASSASGTAILGYLLARRRHTGRVSTTDADALWKEAGELRRDYQTAISRLSAEITRLQHELAARDKVIAELQEKLATQEARHVQELAQLRAQHTREIAELGAQYSRQIADLRTENSKKDADRMALQARVDSLEKRRSDEEGAA